MIDESTTVTLPSPGATVVVKYLEDLTASINAIPVAVLGEMVDLVVAALAADRTVYVAGNGGSATSASHLAVDWNRACRDHGWKSRTVSLAESVAQVTALANDIDFSEVFATQLAHVGTSSDLLLVLSVSGSSPNLVRVAHQARDLGMTTLALVGTQGEVCSGSTLWATVGDGDYGLVEDLHLAFNHMVVRAIRGGRALRYPLGG